MSLSNSNPSQSSSQQLERIRTSSLDESEPKRGKRLRKNIFVDSQSVEVPHSDQQQKTPVKKTPAKKPRQLKSDSKQAQTLQNQQMVIDTTQEKPQLFTPEQLATLLSLMQQQ